MGYLELYDRNTCIQVLSIQVLSTCIMYYVLCIMYKKKCTSIVIFSPKKRLNSDYELFSVLLWSFNEIVFLFKES